MTDQVRDCDVLIIGGGPAGLTAGIYSSWLGLKTIILESAVVGGRAGMAPQIENFPGFENGIKGKELAEKMEHQASRLGSEIKTNEEALGMNLDREMKLVNSRKKSYQTTVIIVATGTQRRRLRVSGEIEFLGRGVSYCAVCDGLFFKNAGVAVVGNDEETALDALYLSDIAGNVAIITHGKSLGVEGTILKRLKTKPNIEIVEGKVMAIRGDKVVKAVSILEHNTQRKLEKEVDGVFITLGGVPMTETVQRAGINTDSKGCLIVDRHQKTNVEGVFAAGDCTCGGMQIVTAAGEGAVAAMRASAYIRSRKA
jgi:thioredoxin reductase (NADPH)